MHQECCGTADEGQQLAALRVLPQFLKHHLAFVERPLDTVQQPPLLLYVSVTTSVPRLPTERA
jgi:hypothetical protein